MSPELVKAIQEAERRGILPADIAPALAEARRRGSFPKAETNLAEQGASGLNEGLASMAGMPVDAAKWLINRMIGPEIKMGASAPNDQGVPIPQVESITQPDYIGKPVGGSEQLTEALSPFISNVPPQTGMQELARRGGQELGAGILPGGATRSLAGMGANAAGDITAALLGHGAREGGETLGLRPEVTDTMDLVASLLGGTGGTRASVRSTRPPAPGTDELMQRGVGKMTDAKDAGLQFGEQDMNAIRGSVDARMKGQRAREARHPRAIDARAELGRMGYDDAGNPIPVTLEEIDDFRAKSVGRDVAGNADESNVGVAMKRGIDEGLLALPPRSSAATGRSSGEVLEQLKEGRRDVHQASKAREIERAELLGERSAERAGSGGNTVNRQRQKIGQILDTETAPKRSGQRSGYTPDEVAQMEKISGGTWLDNRLRNVAGLSPAKGALPLAANVAGIGGAAATGGNPLLAAIPGAIGLAAQLVSERRTMGQIDDLLDTIRRGGVSVPKQLSDAAKRAIVAQLLSGTATSPE